MDLKNESHLNEKFKACNQQKRLSEVLWAPRRRDKTEEGILQAAETTTEEMIAL